MAWSSTSYKEYFTFSGCCRAGRLCSNRKFGPQHSMWLEGLSNSSTFNAFGICPPETDSVGPYKSGQNLVQGSHFAPSLPDQPTKDELWEKDFDCLLHQTSYKYCIAFKHTWLKVINKIMFVHTCALLDRWNVRIFH